MTPQLQTVFYGTHEFAVTILDALHGASFITITDVVTQPDKPFGRKRIVQPSPVKIYAEKNNLMIHQPQTLKMFTFDKPIDLAIVAQYGKLIPETLLYLPKHNTLNVHTSLLPKYRGASPIQHALMDGATTTGTTIMCMDKGLDTGPILAQKEVDITPKETYTSLSKKLATASAELLLKTLPEYINGTLIPQPQDETRATLCRQLTRDQGRVSWNNTAQEVYNQYRGLTPWPGIWTTQKGSRLKLITIEPDTQTQLTPGTVSTKNGILRIGCAKGSIIVIDIQPEGKPVMTAQSYLQGNKTIDNTQLV